MCLIGPSLFSVIIIIIIFLYFFFLQQWVSKVQSSFAMQETISIKNA